MHCVQAVWGPVAPQIETSALAVSIQRDHACFTGSHDGSIVSWQQASSDNEEGTGPTSSSLQPVALLQQHQHPVVAMLAGLIDAAGVSHLLSLDAEGWVCLWDVSCWSCLDMQRAAPLPPRATPHMTMLPDQQHVCIIIPATPNQQQHHHHTDHQYSSLHQQQLNSHMLPSAAAAHAPMMLVLHWRSLALVAAPLVSPLGTLLHTTSMASSLQHAVLSSSGDKQQQQQGQQDGWVDDIVAVLAVETAPALAPTAADTVVLAVSSSGYIFAGSLAGTRVPQAWSQAAAAGGSTAPLLQSCLRSNSSSGYGSSTTTHLQLQLLLVQQNCWRVLTCSSFSSSTGMPAHWQQIAQQQYTLNLEPQYNCGSPFAKVQQQPVGLVSQAVSRLSVASDNNRVRFEISEPESSSSSSSVSTCSPAGGSLNLETADADMCESSQAAAVLDNNRAAEPMDNGEIQQENVLQQNSQFNSQERTKAAGGLSRRRRGDAKLAAAAATQQKLLGGMLVLQQQHGQQDYQQHRQSSSSADSKASAEQDIAVVVWSGSGLQEVWAIQQQLQRIDQSTAQQQPERQHSLQRLYGSQQQLEGQEPQRHAKPQLPVLLQLRQLQPWPSALQQQLGQAQRVLAAWVPWQQHKYALVVQQRKNDDSTVGGSSNWSGTVQGQQVQNVEWLASQRQQQDLHIHLCELHQYQPHHHGQADMQQQEHKRQHKQHHHQHQQHWRLQQVHGSLKVPWSRQHLYGSSSSSSLPSCSMHQYPQQQQQQRCNLMAGDWQPALGQQHNEQSMDTDPAVPQGAVSRKRPAADAVLVPDSMSTERAACMAAADQAAELPAGRAKHPRIHVDADQPHSQAAQLQAALQDMQQQKVTHMLLLTSDSPSLYQLAVILASGTILFYDLATYCIPGAAWHPSCCHVGAGHIGPVTTTLQLQFRCPPHDLIAAEPTAGTSAAAGLGSPQGRASLSAETAATASSAMSVPPTPTSKSSNHYPSMQQPQQSQFGQAGQVVTADCLPAEQLVSAVAAGDSSSGCSSRPVCGGVVPLLLTGGADGSVRAYDLRVKHLGQSWMTIHPHTAPIHSFVLPSASSRLPWSTCLLSVDTSGVVALSCLATGTTHRTFHGWELGPPAQLAWSTTRGMLAAGGWDADGMWQVAVWDTYSGQLDRTLSGPPAHMLMAALTQELTSSIRQHKREQQQGLAVATGIMHQAGSRPSSSRVSLDAAAAAHAQAHPAAGTAAGLGRIQTDVSASGSAAAAAVTASRMELIDVTCAASPVRVLDIARPDVLLLDIDVEQLIAQLEAYSKQQQRLNKRHQQPQLPQQQMGYRPSSIDGASSVLSSRRGSFDMSAYAAHSSIAGQTSQPLSPAAAAASAHAASLSHASSVSSQSQLLLSALAAATAGSPSQGQDLRSTQALPNQLEPLQHRQPPPPAVALALQAMCLLHRWGLDADLDQQLLQLLVESGFASVAPLLAVAATNPAAAADGVGSVLQQEQLADMALDNTRGWQSPAGPSEAAVVAAVTAEAGQVASTAGSTCSIKQQLQQEGQLEQQHWLLDVLLQDPDPYAVGGTALLARCPRLSQEVLPSANGALVLGLPRVQQQQLAPPAVAGTPAAGAMRRHNSGGVLGLVLYASPSLLSSRLLAVVSVSKWLMSTAASHTACNAASGLITFYATGLIEHMQQATAVQTTAVATGSNQWHMHSLSTTASSRSSSPLQQQPGTVNDSRVSIDLPLLASITLAAAGLLSEAAQMLLAALVHPAPRGTYPVPALTEDSSSTSPQKQQGGSLSSANSEHSSTAVFTAPGSAAAASCWPPGVLQLALLHHQHTQQQQQQQQQSLQQQQQAPQQETPQVLALSQLPAWLPLLVLSSSAAVAHPDQVPAELLAAVSACLLDVLLCAAPAAASCTAAGVLCEVLRSGAWSCWRPYLGKPTYILQRLCHLVERIHPGSHDSRTAALLTHSAAVVSSHSSVDGSRRSSTDAAHVTFISTTSSSASGLSSSGVSNSSSGPVCAVLAEQPAAVADPAVLLQQHNHKPKQQHHIEGGLFISSSMLNPAGHDRFRSSPTPRGSSSSSSSSSPLPTAGLGGAGVSSVVSAAYRYTGHSTSYSTAGHTAVNSHMQLTHQGSATGVFSISSSWDAVSSKLPQRHMQQQSMSGAVLSVSRAAAVTWLRSVVDVFAGLALVDPAAVLNELSHKLADPSSDSSSSLPLVMSGLARLCHNTAERHVLLPHLGLTAALAVQALDPGRPSLRSNMMQPVSTLVKELTESFPQVGCHNSTLQLAVGSTRPLGLKHKGTASADGSSGGIMRWSVYAGGGRSLAIPGELLTAAAVAIFDMNGGTKRKVLLLPVLLQLQQHGGAGIPANSTYGLAGTNAANSSSLLSLSSNDSRGSLQSRVLPGVIPTLWSGAQGVPAAEGTAQQQQQQVWGSTSSLSSSTTTDEVPVVNSRGLQFANGTAGSASTGVRSMLASNTLTRAEAAMMQHWFGGEASGLAPAASLSLGAHPSGSAGLPGLEGIEGSAAQDAVNPNPAAVVPNVASLQQKLATAASNSTLWGVWLCHERRSSYYPSPAASSQPLMTADDVVSGVAAVAFNPAGDAVVVFIESCHCLVVWKLHSSWTQKLSNLGTSKPSTHNPCAYIPVPPAAVLQQQASDAGAQTADHTTGMAAAGHHHSSRHHHSHKGHQQHAQSHGVAGGEWCSWQLRWAMPSVIDLLYQGRLCASLEVHLE